MTQHTGYTDAYRRDHEAEQAAQAEAQAERDRENAEVRRRYLAGLAATRQAEREVMEADTDAALAPDKERERNRWLADHPDQTGTDFERRAWPRLRANLLADREQAQAEADIAQMRADGRYAL